MYDRVASLRESRRLELDRRTFLTVGILTAQKKLHRASKHRGLLAGFSRDFRGASALVVIVNSCHILPNISANGLTVWTARTVDWRLRTQRSCSY